MSDAPIAPDFWDTKEAVAQRDTSIKAAEAMSRLQEKARSGDIIRDPNAPRMFVSPTHQNDTFLIRPGKNIMAPMQPGMLGLQPIIGREGDIWAEFHSGVCIANGPELLDWLLAHTGDPEAHREYHEDNGQDPRTCSAPVGLCQEQGPGIDDWYKMKLAQIPLAHRAASLDPEIDVDFYIQAAKGSMTRKRSQAKMGEGISSVIEAAENAAAERADGNV